MTKIVHMLDPEKKYFVYAPEQQFSMFPCLCP